MKGLTYYNVRLLFSVYGLPKVIFGMVTGILLVIRVYSSRSLFLDGTAHQGSITCIDGYRDNVLISTGSEDSTVKIVNTNSGKVRMSLVIFTLFTM